jgi:hypothetical protein
LHDCTLKVSDGFFQLRSKRRPRRWNYLFIAAGDGGESNDLLSILTGFKGGQTWAFGKPTNFVGTLTD